MKKMKKIVAGAIAMMMLLTSSLSALAASPQANIRMWYGSPNRVGLVNALKEGYDHDEMYYHWIDGHSSYCLNYTLASNNGQLMTSGDEPQTTMDAHQEKLLHYTLYYGHDYTNGGVEPSPAQKDEYAATQSLVWIIIKGLFGTAAGDEAARIICNAGYDPNYAYSYYVTLRDKVDKAYHMGIPSFAGYDPTSAPVQELKWNETAQRYELTITDQHDLLNEYDFRIDGYQVEKQGNRLVLWREDANTNLTVGTFQSLNDVVDIKGSSVFWLTGKAGYQEMMSTRPSADAIRGYINVKTENIGYGEITKVDIDSGVQLEGAEYGIYSDTACNNLVTTLVTGENGTAKSGPLPVGTYYVKEIKAPQGFVVSEEVYTLQVESAVTTSIEVSNQEQMGAITIYKEGEVLTGWDGITFLYERVRLAGATFKVEAGADIFKGDGTKVYSKGDVIAENLVAGDDGSVILSNLHLGTYLVTEVESIDGYTLNTESQQVELVYEDQVIEVQMGDATIYNQRQRAEVLVEKKDVDTENPLDGAEYTLYSKDVIKNYTGEAIVEADTPLQVVTTDEKGQAQFTVDLPIENQYYVLETKAPVGYVRNTEESFAFSFEYLEETKESKKFSYTFRNERTTAKIELYKIDKELEAPIPQGDATLEDAIYGVYAKEDIVHPDGATGILYEKGTLVTTMTTDIKGEAWVDNLYLGKYFVKEISPSLGYVIDETEHDVVCDYEGDLVVEVVREATSREQVIQQPFQLIKIADDGEVTEGVLLEGAGFQAYLKSELEITDKGEYDFESATPIVLGENGETEVFTNEVGQLVTIPIPYGAYVVVESTTPHNYETVEPFEVVISEHKPEEPQTWRVFIDREFEAKLRIIKKDAETEKAVLLPDTEFRVFNLDTEEYVEMITTYPSKEIHTSFFTDADGDLILPETLEIGTYRIEEVTAPKGYLLNEDFVEIKIDMDTFYEVDQETGEAIITVDYMDTPVVGELLLEKTGEVFVGMEVGLFEQSEDATLQYQEVGLEGAVFELYAAEDIFTPDHQVDQEGNRIVLYQNGQLVSTITTDENGQAKVSDLPLGTYKVVEIEAPEGYVLSKEEHLVTLGYIDDRTPVVQESLTMKNERQKIELSIDKLDSKTGGKVEGAKFGLYAGEDILNQKGEVIIEKDTLLEQAVSDENGVVAFQKDYPFALYYAREIEAPLGYELSEELVTFDTQYEGQEVGISKYHSEFENVPIETVNPKTGDDAPLVFYSLMGIVAMVCGVGIMVTRKKLLK